MSNKKQPKIIGILSQDFDLTQLADEHYYRLFPDRAAERIRQLEKFNERLSKAAQELSQIAGRAIDALSYEGSVRKHLAGELIRAKEAHDRRVKNLDQKKATNENRLRAEKFEKALSDFVSRRVKDNLGIRPWELVDEVIKMPWAAKNKKGERYDPDYLYAKISPLVTRTKAAIRRGS